MLDLINEGEAIAAKNQNKYNQLIDKISADQNAILCTTSGTTSNPTDSKTMLPGGTGSNEHAVRNLNVDPKTVEDEYVSVLPFSMDYGANICRRVLTL